jgi:hypothetical protein
MRNKFHGCNFVVEIITKLCFAADSNVPTVAQDFVFTFFNAWISDKPQGVLLLAIVSNNNNATASVTVTSSYASFSTIHVTVAPYSIFKVSKSFFHNNKDINK